MSKFFSQNRHVLNAFVNSNWLGLAHATHIYAELTALRYELCY